MQNIPLVSIIIPAFNTEKYIGNMLRNVLQQTYNNYEVIVVDDGSTDNTVNIIKNFMGGKIKLIELPHCGVSAARNAGIEMAKGDKIFFWDSDDSVEPTAIADCMEVCNKYKVNAVLYGYANSINGIKGEPHAHELKKEYRETEVIKELMPHFLGHSYEDINNWICGRKGMRQGKEHTALWRIMLNTRTIKNNGLKFNTNLSLGEDTCFINEYFLYETSIGFMDKCLYFLTIRESGANLSSRKNAHKRLHDKLKLIGARNGIDKKAWTMHKINTHPYWEGTLVFSVVEMAMRLSSDKSYSFRQNYGLFKLFVNDKAVKEAVYKFHPVIRLKAIPFLFMRYCGCSALFILFFLIPDKIMKRVFE